MTINNYTINEEYNSKQIFVLYFGQNRTQNIMSISLANPTVKIIL